MEFAPKCDGHKKRISPISHLAKKNVRKRFCHRMLAISTLLSLELARHGSAYIDTDTMGTRHTIQIRVASSYMMSRPIGGGGGVHPPTKRAQARSTSGPGIAHAQIVGPQLVLRGCYLCGQVHRFKRGDEGLCKSPSRGAFVASAWAWGRTTWPTETDETVTGLTPPNKHPPWAMGVPSMPASGGVRLIRQ